MANERYSQFTEETPKSYVQGLFEESSAQKHRLGTVRRLADGREFVYAKMGATNGVAGQLYQTPAVDLANVANVTVANANIGDRVLTITPVTIVAGDLTANTFAEGYVHVSTGASNGQAYKIKSHGTLAANTAANFTLYDKVRSANIVTANSFVTLTRNPCKAVIVHPSPPTCTVVGVCTYVTTANYYVWLQKKGPCAVEVDETVAALEAGYVAYASNGVDGACGGAGANAANIITRPELKFPIGRVLADNANDHWALIDLDL